MILPATVCVLAMVTAGGQVGGEELHVEEVVLSDGAEDVVNDALGAGSQEVAELGGVGTYNAGIGILYGIMPPIKYHLKV